MSVTDPPGSGRAHTPHRRCVACRRVRPKHELNRLAVDAGGEVVLDPAATRPGRGAYVCGPACHAEAVRRRAYPRAFRRPVAAPDEGCLPGSMLTPEGGPPGDLS
ncbi:MAG TPA: YlxR family protein [Solirubrobacteraceae bacterium]|nr:YlxR family protein [Solirubrobacteraceae bacterium]